HRSGDCPAVFCNPTTRTWWTGKDSNLRSPQGAAELESAGFSHPPTRAVKDFRTRSSSREPILQELAHTARHNSNSTQHNGPPPIHLILFILNTLAQSPAKPNKSEFNTWNRTGRRLFLTYFAATKASPMGQS